MKLHRVKTPTLKHAYIAALLPTGVAINYAGSLLRNMLGVPLFLDSGGTLLVTFIAGPWMGVVCAILQACMLALTLGPIHIVEFLPPSIIAIIVGYAARYGITQTWPGLIGTMLVIQPPACLASAFIYTCIYAGIPEHLCRFLYQRVSHGLSGQDGSRHHTDAGVPSLAGEVPRLHSFQGQER